MSEVLYKQLLEASTRKNLTEVSIDFALQKLTKPFAMLTACPIGADDRDERSEALRKWLRDHGHGSVRLLAYWEQQTHEPVYQEWLLTNPLTDKRTAKIERAGLACAVTVGLETPDEVLATIRGQGAAWSLVGVKYPAQNFMQALATKAWLRSNRGGLVSLPGERAERR